ncbi:MAG: Ig-like domain-containing protein [Patescibacteria group bacterium]|jgi:hypothetical protein
MLQWVSNNLRINKNTASLRKILLLVVFSFSLFFATPAVHAQTTLGGEIQTSNNMFQAASGLADQDIRVIIAKIIRSALAFVGIVLVVIILYGGFIWMTAGGNDERVNQAKRIITNGVIGLVVILSSYGIASFVIRQLVNGINGVNGNGGNVNIAFTDQNFSGSGGLGGVIADHYPGRGQINVPRNAKIIITFRRAIVPASLINDTTGNGIFGDCRNVGAANFNWETDCDTLKMDSNFISIMPSGTTTPIRGASAIASVETGGVFTVVLRPFDYLGSDTAKISYVVRVGSGISLDDSLNNNPSIFAGRPAGRDFYEWNFSCDTVLDRLPPRVTGVFPGSGVTESGNSIIQVNFNKPMDPSTLQGTLTAGTGYYVLSGNSVFLRAPNSTLPAGTFRLVNNYQTMEFTPTTACGQNACGSTVYCMPVCDRAGATCTVEDFEVLLRAGKTFTGTSFEAVPFSGVMDVSGNALDGNKNGIVDAVPNSLPVFPDQATGDNYDWAYRLNRDLDLTSPYITQVTPGPNATFIAPNDELSLAFSKRLRAESLYNIRIDEQPTSPEPLCYVPRASFGASGTTTVKIDHCPFLTASTHYYIPIIDSTVEDSHFNCFYPGYGPNGLDATTKASTICDSANPTNCCQTGGSTPLCCNGIVNSNDRAACLNTLKLP